MIAWHLLRLRLFRRRDTRSAGGASNSSAFRIRSLSMTRMHGRSLRLFLPMLRFMKDPVASSMIKNHALPLLHAFRFHFPQIEGSAERNFVNDLYLKSTKAPSVVNHHQACSEDSRWSGTRGSSRRRHTSDSAFLRRLSVRCCLLLRWLIDCLFAAPMELCHVIRSAWETASGGS